MQVRYGAYLFNENGVDISSRTQLVTAPDTGRPLRYITRATIGGWLEGDSQSELVTKETALRSALLKPYQDLRFLTDGGVLTPVSLLNTNSISGVRVLSFDFPGDTGAECDTVRRFVAEVEAEFVVPGAENAIVSFSETLSVQGNGGPDIVFRVPLNAPIVTQIVTPRTVIYAQQSGQAVGHTIRPRAQPPKWPTANWINKQYAVSEFGPRRLGRGFVDFGIQWSYSFQFTSLPIGHPALPPL